MSRKSIAARADAAPPGRRGVGWRILRAVAVVLVGLEVSYLAAMNAFLSTPLFGAVVNGDPDVIDVHYARAWSLFPTRIHAEGLSIRATDSHVEWILRLDEVVFDCPLRDLARKTFHVTRARGHGISFRLRRKVAPGATSEQTRWLPPIDSLGPVGVIPGAPYPGTWRDADWHLWTVHLEDTVAEDVREIWIDGGRFEGDARIAGGFHLKPIRAVDVGPVHLEIRGGRAVLEGATVLEPVKATGSFRLERFDPRVITAPALAHLASLSLDATASIPDVSGLLTHHSAASVKGHVVVPKLALRIVKGVVRDGTRIEARADRLDASLASRSLSAAAEVTADVVADRLSARIGIIDVVTDLGVAIRRVSVAADSAQLDLAAPLADLHAIADVDGAATRDARRVFAPFLDHAPVDIVGGEVRASAHLEAWREGMHGRGSVQVHAEKLDARIEKRARLRGAIDADASFGSFEYEPRGFSGVQLDVHARGLSLSNDDAASLISIAHLSVTATSPHVVPSDPLEHIQAVASIDGGCLSSAVLRDLWPGHDIVLTANDEARFSGDAAVAIHDRIARGTASLRTRGVGFGSRKIHATGDVTAVANVDRWDLANDRISGDVGVRVTNAHGGLGVSTSGDAFYADRIDARVSTDGVTLAHAGARDLDYELVVPSARLPDARALNAFLPSPAIVAIESGSAVVAADIDTRRLSGERDEGEIRASLSGGEIRFHHTHLGGDVTVKVTGHAAPGAGGAFDLEGSEVVMRDVRVTDSAADTSAWSGDLVLQEGRLVLDPTPQLSGNVTLRARDASPLLAVLLRGTLPGLLAPLARMPELAASTDFVVEPDALVVTNLIASGGDLSLLGTYTLSGQQRRGAFVVQKGPFSAGIRLDDEGAHLRLFDLNRWYADQRREARGTVP